MKRNYRTQGRITRTANASGQSIEEKIRTALANKEPIDMRGGEMYTEEKDRVLPETDIRTDRFSIAMAAADKYNRSQTAKGTEAPPKENKNENDEVKQTKEE